MAEIYGAEYESSVYERAGETRRYRRYRKAKEAWQYAPQPQTLGMSPSGLNA